jgi:hypothetical protein
VSPPAGDATPEQAQRRQEPAAPAQHVRGPAAEQQEPAEGQRVGADHPLDRPTREAQRPADVGQRHVADGVVQRDDQP